MIETIDSLLNKIGYLNRGISRGEFLFTVRSNLRIVVPEDR